ncbi:MAG: conserved exported protein of unknown function [Candidatus Thorarchaeota archaeon]|nr:MAG: conserved exported protein of unknown function [Candidatus Thorarchaeota archaeon]
MRSKIRAGMIVVIILSPMLNLISAQPNHSLEWGVDVGDEFLYYLQKKTIDESLAGYFQGNMSMPFITDIEVGQRAIAQVTGLEVIPETVNTTSPAYIPQANCTIIRENDSQILMEEMPLIIMPIGDWDLLEEMNNFTGMEGWTIIDSEETWGSKFEQSFTFAIFVVSIYLEMIYEKVDGSMSRMHIRVTLTGSELVDLIFIKWHPGLTPLYSVNIWLIIIIAIIAMVILVWFIRRRRRLLREDAILKEYVEYQDQEAYTHVPENTGE